ncbi:SesA protein [Colletotrichum asianum]
MAEVIGLIGSVVGILAAAEVAYQKIKSLKGLPEAFAEVALRLPLAQQILRDVKIQSQNASKEVATTLLPVINSCKENSETLETILKKLDPGESASAWSVDRYISLIKSRGKKGRVEDLMKKILEDIHTLASHKAINAATSEELTSLMNSIEKVGKVQKSVPDELLEDDARISISQGAHGAMFNQIGDYTTTWNNFGSGAINNIHGNANFGPSSGQ